MFSLNQKVVYPGHGVACISRVLERTFRGKEAVLFELKFLNKDMTVMVPREKAEEVGIRALSSDKYIATIFTAFAQPARKIDMLELSASNWNKRNKDYQNKLRTGSLLEISEIYRDLKEIAKHKELSFGEKALLQKTEALLAEEISAAQQLREEQAIEHLRSFFVPNMQQMA